MRETDETAVPGSAAFSMPPRMCCTTGAGLAPEPKMFSTIEPMINLGRAETKARWENGCEIFTLSPAGRFHPTWARKTQVA